MIILYSYRQWATTEWPEIFCCFFSVSWTGDVCYKVVDRLGRGIVVQHGL